MVDARDTPQKCGRMPHFLHSLPLSTADHLAQPIDPGRALMLPEFNARCRVAGAAAGQSDVLIADGQICPCWCVGHRDWFAPAGALQGVPPEDAQGVVPLAGKAQALLAVAALIALSLLIGREVKGPALAHLNVDVPLALGERAGTGLQGNGVVVAAELAVGDRVVGAGRRLLAQGGDPDQGQQRQD